LSSAYIIAEPIQRVQEPCTILLADHPAGNAHRKSASY
jgi:hypothetical protein